VTGRAGSSPSALREVFVADLRAIGVEPAAAAIGHGGAVQGVAASAFIDRSLAYAALLARWNAKIRLVGPTDLTTIVREQLVDALGFVLALDALDVDAFWDIGAGGGLPGLVLALRFPARTFVMVEPIGKKTAFLQHAAHELGLANVHVHQGRLGSDGVLVPALAIASRPRAAFSRATLAPEPWLASARQLVGPGGLVLIAVTEALPEAVAADTGSTPAGLWTWTVPATGAPRALFARRIAPAGPADSAARVR